MLITIMATHSSILAWDIPWTEEPGGATVRGVTESWTQLSDLAHIISGYIKWGCQVIF